jgi:DDE superfamily endonuclease
MMSCLEPGGVSSLCRFWGLNERGYLSLLNFFRSSAWNHESLMQGWSRFVLRKGPVIDSGDRLLALVDHTLKPKDGRRMPGVVSLRQTSETQSKPGYFRGHCWSVLSLVVGSTKTYFSLPVLARIDQGHQHLRNLNPTAPESTQTQRPVIMAQDFAKQHFRRVLLVLDAYFCVEPAFAQAASICDETGEPWVHLLTKAKRNYVAQTAEGERLKLWDRFDSVSEFAHAQCQMYGEKTTVSFLAENLYWGDNQRLIRFIWVTSPLGQIILMTSNLELKPEQAIEGYALRMKIETMFDRLKNLIAAFDYHFWSTDLPKHSRRPKKNAELLLPDHEKPESIQQCWNAYERFVNLGCLALGMLQLISLTFSQTIRDEFQGFLRTQPNDIPSERVTRSVLSKHIQNTLGKVKAGATLRMIHDYHKKAGFLAIHCKALSEDLCDSYFTA